MRNIIGIDIGGTNLRIGLVQDGTLTRGETFSSTGTFAEGDEIARLGTLIEDFRGTDPIDAVSIGFPSSIGADGKTPLNVPNIIKSDGSRAFSGKDVATPLEKAIGTKVFVNKDANHLLCYDASTLSGADAATGSAGTLVGCYIGTGFGSAVMIGGQLVKGKNGSAMEAGHIPFFGSERQCNCGKAGCAECYASGRAAKEILDTQYPGLGFEEMYQAHAKEAPVAGLVEAIAVTTATLVNLFDPHVVFLGGGVISLAFPRESLVEAIKRHTLAPYPRQGLDIRFSAHDAFAGVLGAATCAERLLP